MPRIPLNSLQELLVTSLELPEEKQEKMVCNQRPKDPVQALRFLTILTNFSYSKKLIVHSRFGVEFSVHLRPK